MSGPPDISWSSRVKLYNRVVQANQKLLSGSSEEEDDDSDGTGWSASNDAKVACDFDEEKVKKIFRSQRRGNSDEEDNDGDGDSESDDDDDDEMMKGDKVTCEANEKRKMDGSGNDAVNAYLIKSNREFGKFCKSFNRLTDDKRKTRKKKMVMKKKKKKICAMREIWRRLGGKKEVHESFSGGRGLKGFCSERWHWKSDANNNRNEYDYDEEDDNDDDDDYNDKCGLHKQIKMLKHNNINDGEDDDDEEDREDVSDESDDNSGDDDDENGNSDDYSGGDGDENDNSDENIKEEKEDGEEEESRSQKRRSKGLYARDLFRRRLKGVSGFVEKNMQGRASKEEMGNGDEDDDGEEEDEEEEEDDESTCQSSSGFYSNCENNRDHDQHEGGM